jgi:hypothetical protein
MSEKVTGLLRDVSELIVATVVEETETMVVVKNPAFLGISGQNGQININFIPLEMLSLTPAVNIRNLLANAAEPLLYAFEKKALLQYDLKLAQNVVDNYNSLTTARPAVDASPKPPTDNIVKLF